jgi:hypothetical protein
VPNPNKLGDTHEIQLKEFIGMKMTATVYPLLIFNSREGSAEMGD